METPDIVVSEDPVEMAGNMAIGWNLGNALDASKWMDRVKHLVDVSLDEGMCVIINIHHDNLTESEMENNPGFALTTDTEVQAKSKAFIKAVWAQVSETF